MGSMIQVGGDKTTKSYSIVFIQLSIYIDLMMLNQNKTLREWQTLPITN